MKSKVNFNWAKIGAAALGLIAAACDPRPAGPGDQANVPVEPADVSAPLVAGPARDLAVITNAALDSFRADGSAYVASHRVHKVRVVDGMTEVTPITFDANGAQIVGGAIALQTGTVFRDDGTNVAGAIDATRLADGKVEIVRGVVQEEITNREDGIQQEWRFEREPDGSGDITVEVAVSGQQFVVDNDSGLHFKSPQGLGFKYSDAIWVDSAGKEWPIASKFDNGRIVINVPADVLAQTTFPAVLDPTVTAEVAVDVPVNGHTGASARTPSVAFDGTNYLVVWADNRVSADDDIYATRVSQAGVVLDSNGLKISATAGAQRNPQVAFAGGKYVVAWEDFKVTGGVEADVVAATVSTAGVVTQLGAIANTVTSETQPALAGRGTDAMLVWNANGNIAGAVFNGTAFGAAVTVAGTAASEVEPAVAANPAGGYLVAWSEGAVGTADARGQLVTSAGALSGAAFDISKAAGAQNQIATTFDGTNFATVWGNNNAGINLYGTRISTAGVVLDTRVEATLTVGGIAISVAANNQEFPSIACFASGCTVLWGDRRNVTTNGYDVYGQLLTSAFALSGAEFIVSNPLRGQQLPVVVAGATNYFSVWSDQRDNSADTVIGSRITTAAGISDVNGIVLTLGNNREVSPTVGRATGILGVFWSDSRLLGNNIQLIRFNGNGSKLDTTAKIVSSAQFAQLNPVATIGNTANFQVVWSDSRGIDRDIYTARVDQAGNLLDATGVAVSTGTADQLVPAVATSGTTSLVVWQDRRAGSFDIRGAVIDATGASTVADFVICGATGDQTRPAVAWDSTNSQWMVVWSDSRIPTDPNIYAARVSAAGVTLDSDGVLISGAALGQFAPDLAFANGSFLAAWEDRRVDTAGDIYGTRLLGGASLQIVDAAGLKLSNGVGSQTSVDVASAGTSFIAAWTDGRTVGTTGTDIYGVQIATSGTVTGTDFVISNAVENELSPALAEVSTGNVRIAYEKVRPDLETVRVQTRQISVSSAVGQTCGSNAQCSTGFCVDNRCCDTACGGDSKSDCQACSFNKTLQPDGTCAPVGAGTICRNYASTTCDLREYCDGVLLTCPPDIGRNQGLVCNSTTSTVCPSNAAPGPHACP